MRSLASFIIFLCLAPLVSQAEAGDELSDGIKVQTLFAPQITFQVLSLDKLKNLSVADMAIVGGEIHRIAKVDGAYIYPNEPSCYLGAGSNSSNLWKAFKNGLALPIIAISETPVGSRTYVNLSFDRDFVVTCGKAFTNYFTVKDLRDAMKGMLKVVVPTR